MQFRWILVEKVKFSHIFSSSPVYTEMGRDKLKLNDLHLGIVSFFLVPGTRCFNSHHDYVLLFLFINTFFSKLD